MVTPGADPGLVLFSAASSSQLPDLACKRQNEGRAVFTFDVGRDLSSLCWDCTGMQ